MLICHIWFLTRSAIYHFVLYMTCGTMFLTKSLKFQIFLKFFLFIQCFHTLKGSRNLQGLAFLRAVLFIFNFCCWLTLILLRKFQNFPRNVFDLTNFIPRRIVLIKYEEMEPPETSQKQNFSMFCDLLLGYLSFSPNLIPKLENKPRLWQTKMVFKFKIVNFSCAIKLTLG